MDRNIIILEDNAERIRGFERAIASIGNFRLHIWRNAHKMIADCLPLLPDCCLTSLDHDLNADPGDADPGTGLDVSVFLAKQEPTCPAIIHTSNIEGRWSMYNELMFGNWRTEIIAPIGENWIETSWLQKAKSLINICPERAGTTRNSTP